MPQEMIRVGLVGVTGYTGMELARLLTGHPNMKLTAALSLIHISEPTRH